MLNGIKYDYLNIVNETDKEIRLELLEILIIDLIAYISTISIGKDKKEAILFLQTITATMM